MKNFLYGVIFFVLSFIMCMLIFYFATIPNGAFLQYYLIETILFVSALSAIGGFVYYKYLSR